MIKQNIKVAVDAVVFGYHQQELQILLIKRKIPPFQGQWALPGGFVLDSEDLETAVRRELSEETGISLNYLEQLYSYGDTERDPRFRVVSITYYAFVGPNQFATKASSDAEKSAWFNYKDLPSLAFDHQKIIAYALQRLQAKLSYEPIGFDLLPKKFLFSELEKLYATVLTRPLDRRNFRKKMLSFDILEELKEKKSEGPGRPASLYKFNKARYFHLKRKGFYFEIH